MNTIKQQFNIALLNVELPQFLINLVVLNMNLKYSAILVCRARCDTTDGGLRLPKRLYMVKIVFSVIRTPHQPHFQR